MHVFLSAPFFSASMGVVLFISLLIIILLSSLYVHITLPWHVSRHKQGRDAHKSVMASHKQSIFLKYCFLAAWRLIDFNFSVATLTILCDASVKINI